MSETSSDKPVISAEIRALFDRIKIKYDENWWDQSLTEGELAYLRDCYPYLQIIDGENEVKISTVKLLTAESGWAIQDFIGACSSSVGTLALNGRSDAPLFPPEEAAEEEDEGGSGAAGEVPSGTVWQQAFDTAFELVAMAKERNWASVYLYSGHPYMIRAAWIAATYQYGLATIGFEPSENDFVIRERFMQSNKDFSEHISKVRKKLEPS